MQQKKTTNTRRLSARRRLFVSSDERNDGHGVECVFLGIGLGFSIGHSWIAVSPAITCSGEETISCYQKPWLLLRKTKKELGLSNR